MDILENGDHYYDPRTGKTKRVPAKLRDVHKVMGDTIDKRVLLKKDPAEREEKQQITADHLIQLANAFAQMAQGKHATEVKTPVYCDVESVVEEEDSTVLLPVENNT